MPTTWTPAPRAGQQASGLWNRGGSSCRASCHTQAVPARRFPSQRGARYATIIALLALSRAFPRMRRWYDVSCSTMSALLRRDLGEGRGRVGALPGRHAPGPTGRPEATPHVRGGHGGMPCAPGEYGHRPATLPLLAASAGGEDHEATQGWRARHVPAPGDVRVDGHRVTSLQ